MRLIACVAIAIAAVSFASSASAKPTRVNGRDSDCVVFKGELTCADNSELRASPQRDSRQGADQQPGVTHSTWQDQPRPDGRRFGESHPSSGRHYYAGEFPTRPSVRYYPRPVVMVEPMLSPPCGVAFGNVYVGTSCYYGGYGGMRYRPAFVRARIGGHYGRRRWR